MYASGILIYIDGAWDILLYLHIMGIYLERTTLNINVDHQSDPNHGSRCVGSAIHPDHRNADFLKHVSGKRRSSSAMLDEALLAKAGRITAGHRGHRWQGLFGSQRAAFLFEVNDEFTAWCWLEQWLVGFPI